MKNFHKKLHKFKQKPILPLSQPSSGQKDKTDKNPLHSECSLDEVPEGTQVEIIRFEGPSDISLRFMEMGLCVHDKIRVLNQLPFGGNLVILSENGKYSLRKEFAQWITVIR